MSLLGGLFFYPGFIVNLKPKGSASNYTSSKFGSVSVHKRSFRGGCEFVLKFSLASKQSVCTSVAERQMHRTVTMEQRRMH